MLATAEPQALAAAGFLASGLFAAVAGLLYFAGSRVAGSTLRSAWAWSLFSSLCLACSELALAAWGSPVYGAAHLRYAAAVTTCAPIMAVLGARRPQHRGWQFVVATLLVVLWLPAAQAAVFWPQAPLALHPAMKWFLALLVLWGGFNYLATRNALIALLACIGQLLLLRDYLPLVPRATAGGLGGAHASLCAGALFVVSVLAARWCAARPATRLPGIDRAWLAFRDRFGTFWALRVLGRFHAAAGIYRWQFTLGWHGLVRQQRDPAAAAPSEDELRQMAEQMATLLRRFESPAWLQAQLSPSACPQGLSASQGR
jgi:hypothetical protein